MGKGRREDVVQDPTEGDNETEGFRAHRGWEELSRVEEREGMKRHLISGNGQIGKGEGRPTHGVGVPGKDGGCLGGGSVCRGGCDEGSDNDETKSCVNGANK